MLKTGTCFALAITLGLMVGLSDAEAAQKKKRQPQKRQHTERTHSAPKRQETREEMYQRARAICRKEMGPVSNVRVDWGAGKIWCWSGG